MSLLRILTCALLLAALFCLTSATGCLPTLRTARRQFDVCLRTSNECFIFLNEPPFVFIDEDDFRADPKYQKPFLCANHKNHSKSLEGAFFDIVKAMSKSLSGAYCIWGGPSCTFDSLVNFINDTTKEEGYKWIAGGLLFLVPERRQLNLIPTTPLLEDQLRIIGPPLEGTSARESWDTIWKPFTVLGWLVIVAALIGLFVMRAFMALRFSSRYSCVSKDRYSWRERFIQFAGGPSLEDDCEDEQLRVEQQEENERWERMNSIWVAIAKLFIAITIIMWEVAIAVLVFESRTVAPRSDLPIEGYAIWKGTTQEYFLRVMNRLNTTEDAKWARLASQEDVYKVIQDDRGENRKRQTTVQYSIFNRYQFKDKPQLCDKLRQYDTVPASLVRGREPPSISGVWLMSANVEPHRRVAIDQEILEEKTFNINRYVNSYAGDEMLEQCKATTRKIDWLLLVFLFGLAMGPLCLVFTVGMLYFVFVKKSHSLETDNNSTQPQYFVDTLPEQVDIQNINGPLRQRLSRSGNIV